MKALHVMAVIAWMAGLFYLPRLFVYHVEGYQKHGVEAGSEMDLLFQHQERLLLKAIINPSAVVASGCSGCVWCSRRGSWTGGRSGPGPRRRALIGMTWFHYWLALRRKDFAAGKNVLTGRQYRMMNELPTVLMAVIVASVIVKF